MLEFHISKGVIILFHITMQGYYGLVDVVIIFRLRFILNWKPSYLLLDLYFYVQLIFVLHKKKSRKKKMGYTLHIIEKKKI